MKQLKGTINVGLNYPNNLVLVESIKDVNWKLIITVQLMIASSPLE